MTAVTTMTLAQLRTAAKQRADMESSGFVSDTEWTQMLNQSGYELYDLLVQTWGSDYFVATPYQFTTDGTSSTVALPVDFYKAMGLDYQSSSGPNGWVTVTPFNFRERNKFSGPLYVATGGTYGSSPVQYRINGSNILFIPSPSAGLTFQLYYIPRWTQLAAESDTLDGISGYTEYVIVDAAIKAMQKEESDVSALMAQKQALIQRIQAAADNRDAGSPQTVSDAYAGNGWNGFGPGWSY